MPVVKVPDASGTTLTLQDIDGYKIPNMPLDNYEEEFRAVRGWTLSEDDVLVSAYPKAGTHWIWEIANMLMNQNTTLSETGKEYLMVEALTRSRFAELKSPKLLNTHVYLEYLPEDFIKKKCKIIYIIRNPKDVSVSFYNHHRKLLLYEYDGKWEDYFKRFVEGNVDYGSWFDYMKHWEQFMKDNPDHPVHVIHYEDLKANGVDEVEKLGKFLEIHKDRSFYQEVYDNCHINKMKESKSKGDTTFWRDGTPGMYRKGEVGDWKNWFTVAQSEYFDSVYKEKMKDSKVEVRVDIQ